MIDKPPTSRSLPGYAVLLPCCGVAFHTRQIKCSWSCCAAFSRYSASTLQVWTFSNPLGNPASLYPAEMRTLFDAAFRADYVVQKSILGFDHDYLKVQAVLQRAKSCIM